MEKLFLWLKVHTVWNVGLVITVYLFGVFAHLELSRPFNWMASVTSLATLNVIMQTIALVIMVVLFYQLFQALRLHLQRSMAGVYALITLALFLAAYFILMPYKSEFMHFPQYALLTLLLIPLHKHIFSAFILGVLLGFFDEGYQFIAFHKLYFDFNDIILNIIGCALGLMMAFIFWPVEPSWKSRSSIFLWFWYGLLGVLFLLFLSGTIHFFVDQGPWHWHRNIAAAFSFDFWVISSDLPPWHVVTPYEGIFLLALLPALYWPFRQYKISR